MQNKIVRMSVSYYSLFVVSLILLANQSLAKSYGVPDKVYYDLDLSKDLFETFVSEYQKQYSAEEADYRHKIFQENLKRINELNKKHETAVFGLTPFTDLTSAEFSKRTSCLFNASDVEPAVIPDIEAPDSLDWREHQLVTEVKFQSTCGSCYIFSAIAEIEGQHAKLHQQLISLSEQYPLDCGDRFGCHGGHPDEVMNWFSTTQGAIKEQDYPYVNSKTTCRADPAKGVVKVSGGSASSVGNNEELKILLAAHGPLSVALFAHDDMRHYRGGVLIPTDCANQEVNHAVTLVGYGKEQDDYWIIKNSWGSNWGEQGYVRLAVNMCGVGEYVAQSVVV